MELAIGYKAEWETEYEVPSPPNRISGSTVEETMQDKVGNGHTEQSPKPKPCLCANCRLRVIYSGL